jgi:hypothetical protein
MKAIISAAVILAFVTSVSYATSINVDIDQLIQCKNVHLEQTVSGGIVNITSEFYNTGSIPYGARLRLFIINGTRIVFSGWSEEYSMMPGDKSSASIYWHAPAGSYSAFLRAYYGNEIEDYESFDIDVSNYTTTQDVFRIGSIHTYDERVVFDITSDVDANDVVIVPEGYASGWVFEQRKVSLKKGVIKTVSLAYAPTVWQPSVLRITASSAGYHSQTAFQMVKEQGLMMTLNSVFDSLKMLLL